MGSEVGGYMGLGILGLSLYGSLKNKITDLYLQTMDNSINLKHFEEAIKGMTRSGNTIDDVDYEIVPLDPQALSAPVANGTQLEGLTARNMAQSTALTDWTAINSGHGVAAGVISNTGDGTDPDAFENHDTGDTPVTGDEILLIAEVLVTNAVCNFIRLYLDGTTGGTADLVDAQAPPTINTWYLLSGIGVVAGDFTGNIQVKLQHNYADNAAQSGKVLQIRNVRSINLTQTYGAGNEPSAANGLKTFPRYFEDTQSVKGNGCFRGVTKNILIPPMESGNILGATGLNQPNAARIRTKLPTLVSPSTQYKLSATISLGGHLILVYQYERDGTYISELVISGASNVFTTSALTGRVRFVDRNSTDITSKFQLEYGSVATDFIDYKQTQLFWNAGQDLRNVPAIEDRIFRLGGKWYLEKNITPLTLTADDITNLNTELVNFDYITILKTLLVGSSTWSASVEGKLIIGGFPFETDSDGGDVITRVGSFSTNPNTLFLIVAKGAYADIPAAKAGLAGTALQYELATPITTEIETTGSLHSEPSGTSYRLPNTADVQKYDSGLTATGILTLVKITKIDPTTGVETVLDVADASLSTNSFTHSELSDDEWAYFEFSTEDENPEGEFTVVSFNDTHVIVDSVTDTIYRLTFSVASGFVSMELEDIG